MKQLPSLTFPPASLNGGNKDEPATRCRGHRSAPLPCPTGGRSNKMQHTHIHLIRFTWVLSAQNADTMIDNPLAGRNISPFVSPSGRSGESCEDGADRVTRSTARYWWPIASSHFLLCRPSHISNRRDMNEANLSKIDPHRLQHLHSLRGRYLMWDLVWDLVLKWDLQWDLVLKVGLGTKVELDLGLEVGLEWDLV